jgi:hypothetical protein
VAHATLGLSAQGARERRRHARLYSEWCALLGLDPAASQELDLSSYLASTSDGGDQLRSKTLCSLRAVLREVDPLAAARTAGLGIQVGRLDRLDGTPPGELVKFFLGLNPHRRAVRKAGLTRLLAWCSEVGLELTDLFVGDLHQFAEWLREVRAFHRETVGIAKDLIQLRHSKQGRSILGEGEAVKRHLLIETAPPMRPRFHLRGSRTPWLGDC